MNLQTRVIYAWPNNGYIPDQEQAKKYLKLGQIYTISKIEIEEWKTKVWFREIGPDVSFNSVMFEYVKEIGDKTVIV